MGGREAVRHPVSMTGQGEGISIHRSRDAFSPSERLPHSENWEWSRPVRSAIPGFPAVPARKVWGDDSQMETVLEFPCTTQPGATPVMARGPRLELDLESGLTETAKRWEQGGAAEAATPPPHHSQDSDKAVACRTTCSCMTTICVTSSKLLATATSLPASPSAVGCSRLPRRTATPLCENLGRLETELFSRPSPVPSHT
ncbi:hypothetical protein QBC39DRAFT_46384 [Podospora conica]|nr:hypothetical protein QBC39DRAFT_46384 [Schizothecium conicum]